MRIHEVKIDNFRSINKLLWRPTAGMTALVGPGDTGKTTILDALGLLFSSRWNITFTDNDFHGAKPTEQDLVIQATVVDPPKELMRLEAFAGYIRGVGAQSGEIVDEPDTEDPAITVELRVDRFLEPRWHVLADRQAEPALLRGTQRAAFRVVRVGADTVTDLRWSRNSALVRITGSADQRPTAAALIDAARASKAATASAFSELDAVVASIGQEAYSLRAVSTPSELNASLNSDSLILGEGAVSLHDGLIPMERHGLGSRRLVGTAVQLMDSAEACVILVDEVETGLEPYRLRHLLRAFNQRLEKERSLNQVFVTTHSAVTVRELKQSQLGVVRRTSNLTRVLTLEPGAQRILRANAEAFLAPRVLICEGATEVGFARGVFDHEEMRDANVVTAVATADAAGESNLVEYSRTFEQLGYRVGIFCDFDTELDLTDVPSTLIRCDKGLCTEEQMSHALGRSALIVAINHGIGVMGRQSVLAALANRGCTVDTLERLLAQQDVSESDLDQVRHALGAESSKGNNKAKWFKSVTGGETLASIVMNDTTLVPTGPAGTIIASLMKWAVQ